MNLGVIMLLITGLGYVSNWFNWRYLNYKITQLMYYLGALVHETSHALLCLATGAKIEEFKVFSRQPHVIHGKSKLPFLGELLISSAPIAGGLLFLFLVNRYLLANYLTLMDFSGLQSWRDVFIEPLRFLARVDIFEWQSWVVILLFINMGAMVGPSFQDLKNIWPLLIVLFFVKSEPLAVIGLSAVGLIVISISVQIILIAALGLMRALKRTRRLSGDALADEKNRF